MVGDACPPRRKEQGSCSGSSGSDPRFRNCLGMTGLGSTIRDKLDMVVEEAGSRSNRSRSLNDKGSEGTLCSFEIHVF